MPNVDQQTQPRLATGDERDDLLWTALVGSVVACGLPLLLGIGGGWSIGRALLYTALALIFVVLTQAPRLPGLCRLLDRIALYLALMGVLALALQTISGDPFFQPIAIIVPFVFAAFHYAARGTIVVGATYLALTVLGLWLSGERAPRALVFPVIAYAALMALISGFATLSIQQVAARQRADQLAVDLAQQRDYLAQLVAITATLTRDLQLDVVLGQVAAAGRTLARADQAYVWLRDTEDDSIQLVAPAPRPPTTITPHVKRTLETGAHTLTATEAVVPLIFKGSTIGALDLRHPPDQVITENEVALLQPFADAAAIAIQNAQLYAQQRWSATLAERNRIARELHDTIAQGLTAITMQLEAAQRSFERDPNRARSRLARGHELARETLADVRRGVWLLATPHVDDRSLTTQIDQIVARFGDRTGIPASYQHSGTTPTLDQARTIQIMRIVQEALHNVEKHAHAQQVQVRSHGDRDTFTISIGDNGGGIAAQPSADGQHGFGLISMRERARLIDGTLAITSVAENGTCVTLTLPIDLKSHEAKV